MGQSNEFGGILIAAAAFSVFCGLQVLVYKRMPGSVLALMPGALVFMTALFSAFAALQGSNLWPIALMLVLPFSILCLVVLLIIGTFNKSP